MTAKYLALAQALRQALPEWYARGVRRLPGEQELAAQYHVSRQTVRQALAALDKGYHLVLEKPISPLLDECLALQKNSSVADLI